jgi:hypothetical protein
MRANILVDSFTRCCRARVTPGGRGLDARLGRARAWLAERMTHGARHWRATSARSVLRPAYWWAWASAPPPSPATALAACLAGRAPRGGALMAPEFRCAASASRACCPDRARAPVGLAMLLVGMRRLRPSSTGRRSATTSRPTPYHLFANYTLSVIPLFI